MKAKTRKVYCIFHLAPDKEPSWYDENDLPVTHKTKTAAVAEILGVVKEHIRQIESGDRDIEEGIGFDDWVEEVTVNKDGSVVDFYGTVYGKRES